jgi:hypothetical protein
MSEDLDERSDVLERRLKEFRATMKPAPPEPEPPVGPGVWSWQWFGELLLLPLLFLGSYLYSNRLATTDTGVDAK